MISKPCPKRALELAAIPDQHYSLDDHRRTMLFWCAETIQDGLIVELGVCHGGTGLMLAYVASCLGSNYLGVDDWSLEGSYENVVSLFAANLVSPPAWTLIKGKTQEVSLPSRPINMLFIDAGHDEANVFRDVERWVPRVMPGGIVAFDDYPQGPDWLDSCHWAVRQAAENVTASWEHIGSWEGLLIRRKSL